MTRIIVPPPPRRYDPRTEYERNRQIEAADISNLKNDADINFRHTFSASVRDNGGAGYNVTHPDYGAIGDGATDDTTALQAAFTAASTAGVPVIMPAGTYLTSSTLTATNLHIVAEGIVEIRRTTSADDEAVIAVAGSVGSYSAIDANALVGSNIITDAGLAGSLSEGDLIQIRSALVFNGTSTQGEMATVRIVSGNDIYLNETLHDTYNTANTAEIALVSPGSFSVTGRLVIENTPATVNSLPYGITLAYCMRPHGDIEFRRCQADSLILYSCYAPDFRVLCLTSGEEDPGAAGGNGYGINVANSTMYGRFTGVIQFSRHAINVGAAGAYEGVAWECVFHDVIATGGDATHIFDAHGPVGSVSFVNCTAIGGTVEDPVAADGVPSGFQVGARHAYIKDCRSIRCATGIGIRDDGETLENLVIDGFSFVEGTGNAISLNPGSAATINNLIVRNVHTDDMDGSALYGVGLGANLTVADSWLFENIHVRNAGILSAGHSAGPDVLELTNCSTDYSSNPSNDANFRGVSISSADLVELHLNGCKIRRVSRGIRVMSTATALTDLKIKNSLFDLNTFHIFLSVAGPDDIRVVGSDFLGALSGSGVAGVINADVTNTFTVLEVIGCRVDTDGFFIGDLGGATTVINVGNNVPASFRMERQNNANVVELLGGQLNGVGHYRGTGTPESSLAAPIGSTFARDDGGTGTSFYVKESGTGNTGWVAK